MKKLILAVGIAALLATGCSFHNIDEAKRNFDYAFEFCGKDNIHQINYTDGSTSFRCEDYSKVK